MAGRCSLESHPHTGRCRQWLHESIHANNNNRDHYSFGLMEVSEWFKKEFFLTPTHNDCLLKRFWVEDRAQRETGKACHGIPCLKHRGIRLHYKQCLLLGALEGYIVFLYPVAIIISHFLDRVHIYDTYSMLCRFFNYTC